LLKYLKSIFLRLRNMECSNLINCYSFDQCIFKFFVQQKKLINELIYEDGSKLDNVCLRKDKRNIPV